MNIIHTQTGLALTPHEASVRTNYLRAVMPRLAELDQRRAKRELAELDRIIRPETAFDGWDYPTIY